MTFVSISDNLLSLLVMFTIVFGVALPKFSLFLVQLIFVVLLLFLLFDLTVQISTDILFLFSSEFLVFWVLLLLSLLLQTHMFIDLLLFHFNHFLLFLNHCIILLIDELKSFLFSSLQFFLTGFFLLIQQSAIVLLGFNISLFFLVKTLNSDLFVNLVFFFKAFEMFNSLNFSLELQRLSLLFLFFDSLDQNGIQLFLSFFFVSLSSGFVVQLTISGSFFVLDFLELLSFLLFLSFVKVLHLQLQQLGILVFFIALGVLHKDLLLDLFLQLVAIFLLLFFRAQVLQFLFLLVKFRVELNDGGPFIFNIVDLIHRAGHLGTSGALIVHEFSRMLRSLR